MEWVNNQDGYQIMKKNLWLSKHFPAHFPLVDSLNHELCENDTFPLYARQIKCDDEPKWWQCLNCEQVEWIVAK